ncbi:MAG: hypothetical protein ABF976_06105 [Acetobacter syzygii]|uniref:hypothetical protein n=1 Tax=Acetobacter syzygii TaxID=146476 RepID=UPI00242FC9DB|nr:hypothetical protein [Acetobacter syzygii]
MAERFVFSDQTKSIDTIKGTTNSVALFTEAFGDMPVADVTGKIAGEFRDLLSGLPAHHGKGKSTPPIREAVAQAEEFELDTVSGKTVKNHFSRMSTLWRHLVQRDYAARNPFEGWKFDITKKIERRAWSEQELQQLLSAPWTSRVTSGRTYQEIIQTSIRLSYTSRLADDANGSFGGGSRRSALGDNTLSAEFPLNSGSAERLCFIIFYKLLHPFR